MQICLKLSYVFSNEKRKITEGKRAAGFMAIKASQATKMTNDLTIATEGLQSAVIQELFGNQSSIL